ncbi:MAG TPA: hypothetical protein PLC04_08225 [Candidatus Kapabacteria bacterium]|nr:hypothetical protein [Candidatus Kapabacteria bacterium]
MEIAKRNFISIIGNRITTTVNGLKQLINFKKSLIVLLIFVLIDIPFTFIDFKIFSAGQPYIGKWESTMETISIAMFLLALILFIIVNYPNKISFKLQLAMALSIVAFCIIAGFLMVALHLESLFEVGVIGIFLFVVVSLLIISNLSDEKKLKYKLVSALDIGLLWMFIYWIVTFILNWYILYNLFV